MKTNILRLDSVVPNGVGGPEAGAIDLIYSFLLQRHELTQYSYIHINQIGEDLDELIFKEGKKIYINIKYPVYPDFEIKSLEEKNRIRLDVVHTSLLRIAVEDKKLDSGKLIEIRDEILKNNFSFYFDCKIYPNKKRRDLIAKIVIHPEINKFDYYLIVLDGSELKCKAIIYSGLTVTLYFRELFSLVRWKNENEFIVTGKNKEVEIALLVDKCKLTYKNLTKYEKPPYFEMMKARVPEKGDKKAYQDWLHSLPPDQAAILNYEPS